MKSTLREQRLRARNALTRAAASPSFKPVSSAKWVDISRNWRGVYSVKIEHDSIRGVAPAMMRWWFEHLGEMTTWNGRDQTGPEVSHYQLWHHRDHIAVKPLTDCPDGTANHGFAVGAESEIRERFNDYNDLIRARVTTERLDDEEFTFTVKRLGIRVAKVIHRYSQEPDGLQFYAETRVDIQVPIIGALLNWLLIPFLYTRETAENWIRHNIEETGRSEDVVPALYALGKPSTNDHHAEHARRRSA